MAAFLFLTGVTGAIISWDHELDEWLNSHLTEARAPGPARPSLELAKAIEARYPTMQVTWFTLTPEPGHSLAFGVEPRVDPATQRLYPASFNQVFLDPASGAELGKREWGAVWPLTRETAVSFLYKLHYSLHLPEMWGTDRWGMWLLGGIALIWTADCFVGFYLTLPARRRSKPDAADELDPDDVPADGARADRKASVPARSWWQRWKPAWKVRWSSGSYKLNFDLHRASGLWTWGVVFVIAFTAFSMNLYGEVFYPIMSRISNVTPTPFDQRVPTSPHEPVTPKLSFAEALESASTEAARRGWEQPAGGVFYARDYGIYSVGFFHPLDDHGVGGVGHRQLYIDAVDGRLLGSRQPWQGTAADIFMQAQFPLHSGRILGVPGRILISVMGLVVALLSVTGVVIWWRKRQARAVAARRSRERVQPVVRSAVDVETAESA